MMDLKTTTTTTDALCRDCAHIRHDADGGRWCHSPQIIAAQGRGTRCIFERDSYPEPERSHDKGTRKCGPRHLNYRRRETP
jgi:hypothetical protein